MENRRFGYIRVSSRDQNEGRQLQSMQGVGISPRDIFIDKQRGYPLYSFIRSFWS